MATGRRANPVYLRVADEEVGRFSLKRNVILGWTDNGSIGSRALLGFSLRAEQHNFPDWVTSLLCKAKQLSSPSELQAASYWADSDVISESTMFKMGPLLIFTLKYEDYSIVVFNTDLTGSQPYIALCALFDLCADQGVEKIIAICQLHLGKYKLTGRVKVFENTLYSHHMTGYPALPDDLLISDPVFMALVQLVQVEQLATNLFILPGTRRRLGSVVTFKTESVEEKPASDGQRSETVQVVDSVVYEQLKLAQSVLVDVTGIKFDILNSALLAVRDTKHDSSNYSSMYL